MADRITRLITRTLWLTGRVNHCYIKLTVHFYIRHASARVSAYMDAHAHLYVASSSPPSSGFPSTVVAVPYLSFSLVPVSIILLTILFVVHCNTIN